MKKFGSAILLAGGKSSRMGFDKQELSVQNVPLVEIIILKLSKVFDDIIVVSNNPEYYRDLPCTTTQDEIIGFGPLSGIHSGLKKAKYQYAFVLACDMPYISFDYIEYMKAQIEQVAYDACVTKFKQEWIEPFHGFYSKSLVGHIEEYLEGGRRSIFVFLQPHNCLYIEEEIARKYTPNWEIFVNINTKEDLIALENHPDFLNLPHRPIKR